MKGLYMGIGNAMSGMSAGLRGRPEDWVEEEKETPKKESAHLLSFFNQLATKGGCENITHKDFSQVDTGISRDNSASY